VEEMLVSAPGGRYIELFPMWPRGSDAAFHNLRVKGAFLVSANWSALAHNVTRLEIEPAAVDQSQQRACVVKSPWEVASVLVTCRDDSRRADGADEWRHKGADPQRRSTVPVREGLLTFRARAAERCSLAPLFASAAACAQCPRRSDVVLSSRWVHYEAVGGPYDTWAAVAAFNATRIDWVYTSNRSFVEAASAHGLSVTPATNANVPDDGDDHCNDQHTQPKSCNWSVGRVLSIDGRPLSSPPGVFRRVAHGCVNSPEYMKIALHFVDELKLTGAKAIQHDDASMNDESVQWSGGNLSASGCYCSHCMAKFTTSLLKLNSSAASKMRVQNNITANWDYRDWLLNRPIAAPHSTPDHSALRNAFVTFQQASTEEYVHTLRSHLDADKSDSSMTLSANNGGSWGTPYHLFDYGIGELELGIGTQMTLLRRLHALFVADVPGGKLQVLTMPKGLELKEWLTPQGTAIVRAVIAVSYALGGHIMVPWDVEFPSGRFYGNTSQYGDLFSFVRRHGSLFDDADQLQRGWLPPAMTEDCAQNFQAHVSLMGTVSATIPAGLRECQSVCDMLAAENASRCIGVRLQDRPNTQPASVGECSLVAAGATALPRHFTADEPVRVYKRLGAPATNVSETEFSGPAVKVNDPQVMAIARSSSNGTGPLLIHLIDSRALAELGCCPSAFKPSFGYHPSNCSPCTASNCSGNTGLSCCRCKHTPLPPSLEPSLELVLTAQVVAGACPKLVRALNLNPQDDNVVGDIRCYPARKQTRFTVSPPPQPWAMLEVHF
jgi:hypothetical protein